MFVGDVLLENIAFYNNGAVNNNDFHSKTYNKFAHAATTLVSNPLADIGAKD